jgi:hypothetical protein
MANFNTDYLQISAENMKELIKRNLSENENFTDHLFEDSNLTTLIDVFSFMFESLIYYVNHGASESIFIDSRVYENMNRIVKMLGYNPLGILTPNIEVLYVSRDQEEDLGFVQKIIPKYTSVDTGLTDRFGNQIYYSTVDDRFINPILSNSIRIMPETSDTTSTLYNGKWRVYDQTFFADGIPYEEFTLDLIDMEDQTKDNYRLIAHPFVHVYIKRFNSDIDEFEYLYFSPLEQGTLFGTEISTISGDEDVFELRLNERKRYTLKFGDGIHGSKLLPEDEIFVVYLQSNGVDGKIGSTVLTDSISPGAITTGISGLDNETYLNFIGLSSDDIISSDDLQKLFIKGSAASSDFENFEDIDSIRDNAPNWFKSNGRLVTAADFRNFIISRYKNSVIDSKVMNNWSYLAEFLGYLDRYNKLTLTNARKENFPFSDSCDFNNVYIWSKYRTDGFCTRTIERSMQSSKTLTVEPILLKALDVNFIPAVNIRYDSNDTLPSGKSIGDLRYDIDNWDTNVENFIEIVRDKNAVTSP